MRITGGKARGITLHAPSGGDIRPATDYLREAVFASLGEAVRDARVLDCFAGTGAYALEAMSRGAAEATLVEQNAAVLKSTRRNAEAVAKSAGFATGAVTIRQADAVQWVKRQAQAAASALVTPAANTLSVPTDSTGCNARASVLQDHAGYGDTQPPSMAQPAQGSAVPPAPLTATGVSYSLIFADPPYPVWEGQPAVLLAALAALLDRSCPASRLVLEAPGNWNPPELAGLELLRHLKKGPRQPSALIYRPA